MIAKEKLDGIDIDDIGNLEDLLRIVFIRECGNLKVFIDGGELPEILTKRRSQTFYKLMSTLYLPICSNSYKNDILKLFHS